MEKTKIVIEFYTDNDGFNSRKKIDSFEDELSSVLDYVLNKNDGSYESEFNIKDTEGKVIGLCRNMITRDSDKQLLQLKDFFRNELRNEQISVTAILHLLGHKSELIHILLRSE